MEGGKLGAEGPEDQGLPQRGMRPLRLEEDIRRSDRNGLKSKVPWSLSTMRYQGPKEFSPLGE